MARNERFPSSFQLHIQNMIQILVSHVRQKSKDRDTQDESRNANVNIASFIKVSPLIIAHDFQKKNVLNNFLDKSCALLTPVLFTEMLHIPGSRLRLQTHQPLHRQLPSCRSKGESF